MSIKGLMRLSLRVALITSPLAAAHAQGYPDKLITIVVPFPAGSATDTLARTVGKGITELSGQNVVVQDLPGANGVLAVEKVAKSRPDGYTILLGTHTTQSANQWLLKNMPYDPVKDFEPVSALAKGWSFLLVNPKSPIKSVDDLVAKAKKAPGTLTYGGGGATSRVSVEMFAQRKGLKFLYVGYKGNSDAINDLIGGRLDFMISDMVTALPQIKAGRLRALAFTGTKRSPSAPNVPTFNEAGVPGYEHTYWQAVYVPSGTPATVVTKLNTLLHKAMELDTAKKYLKTNGLARFLTTPEELAKFQQEQTKMIGEVVRRAGIEPM